MRSFFVSYMYKTMSGFALADGIFDVEAGPLSKDTVEDLRYQANETIRLATGVDRPQDMSILSIVPLEKIV